MSWTAMIWTFGAVCFAAGWLSRELLQRQRDDRFWRYDESDDDEGEFTPPPGSDSSPSA